jgi:hypothetical protein
VARLRSGRVDRITPGVERLRFGTREPHRARLA